MTSLADCADAVWFIADGKDLIVVAILDPEPLLPVLQAADEVSIPVIATVWPIDEAQVVTYVGYDGSAIGRKQGEMLVAALGEEARVAVIRDGDAGSWPDPVARGLTDYLADHPGIEVLERQVAEGDEGELTVVTEELLDTNQPGELDGIVIEVSHVLSAVERVGARGRSDVRVFGGYYSDEIDAAISDGRIEGAVLQDPRPVGATSIVDAYRWLSGDQDAVQRPEHLLTPTIVTTANVDAYPAWAARPTPTPTPTATPEPTRKPSQLDGLTRRQLDRRAHRMCVQARPDRLYSVRARVAPAKAARAMDTAHLVLVEYRDLGGVRRREPRLKKDSVYDLDDTRPFFWEAASDVDVLTCLALRATRRETWQNTTTLALYTIDAADAIIWMVDVTSGERVGQPWLLHPPKPGSGANRIMFGDHGPGLRPPPAQAIIRDVERFLGQ